VATQAKVVLYGSASCGYCAAAKRLLAKKGVSFEDIPVADDEALRRDIAQRSGQQTVPQIFINDESIGGFDDLCELDQSGRLDAMLGQV